MRRGFKSEFDYNSTKSASRGMPADDDAEKKRLRNDNAGQAIAIAYLGFFLLAMIFIAMAIAASKGH